MSHSTFKRTMARDYGLLTLVLAAILTAAVYGPDWAGGVIALVLIPLALIAIVVLDARQSRRRDDTNSPGTDHAHTSEPEPAHSPAAAPNATGPAALSSCRPGRPDLATAWVDFAWACHWSALRRWRSTRPGR
jgi:hypothetical protein